MLEAGGSFTPSIRVTRRTFAVHLWVVLALLRHEFCPTGTVIEPNAMQISLERSGGFTGMPLTITIDTATLSLDQASQLRHLIEAADFFHLSNPSSPTAQPDRFEYEVTVRDGDRTHTITVEEAAIPEPLRPLLNWLIEVARSR